MSYKADWFTMHISTWEKHIKPVLPTGDGLEIGVYEGRSAIWTVQNMLEGNLYCVDPWEDISVFQRFKANVHGAGVEHRLQIIPGTRKDILFLPENSLAWVYVDGNHTEYDPYFDAVIAWRRLMDGGILCFDDYRWQRVPLSRYDHPQHAIDLFLKLHRHRMIYRGYQVIIEKV